VSAAGISRSEETAAAGEGEEEELVRELQDR